MEVHTPPAQRSVLPIRARQRSNGERAVSRRLKSSPHECQGAHYFFPALCNEMQVVEGGTVLTRAPVLLQACCSAGKETCPKADSPCGGGSLGITCSSIVLSFKAPYKR